VVPLPQAFTLSQAMILGTAAFTAALALHQMERNGQHPDMGPILVTGATGGVGSLAVAILSQAGYQVIAATGKPQNHDYLTQLGATAFKTRTELNALSPRPLLPSQWAGAIDNVGGNTLTNALKACKAKGNVAACGLVDSPDFNLNVFPFIIKGINLLGIDSAETPMKLRLQIWHKLAHQWNVCHKLQPIATHIPLSNINHYIDLMLQGNNTGRIIVEM
jgi:putative YhdH/YhfP family quinone oxidoreductase